MKKKILIVEDNLMELERIHNTLKDGGYDGKRASGIAGAEELIKEEPSQSFDCLIVDLNMDNTFLPDTLKPKTHGGSLTGWVWLYNVAKPILTNNPKIIIYSAFAKELEEEIFNDTTDDKEREYFDTVTVISKTAEINGSKILLEKINELLNRKKK